MTGDVQEHVLCCRRRDRAVHMRRPDHGPKVEAGMPKAIALFIDGTWNSSVAVRKAKEAALARNELAAYEEEEVKSGFCCKYESGSSRLR